MKTVEDRLSALEAAVAALRPVDIAGDKYADFTVRRCPPKWIDAGGPDYTGQPISTTSPEFLDALAGFLTWQAEKDEERNHSYINAKGDKVFPAPFARKDAARARAFAAKMRADGAKPAASRRQSEASSYSADTDDSLPF